jgi:hypothetical protein
MKRKNFLKNITAITTGALVPLNTKTFVRVSQNETIYECLKSLFGKEDFLLFKRFVALYPKEILNLQTDFFL